jgi:hypothetical protein
MPDWRWRRLHPLLALLEASLLAAASFSLISTVQF